MLEKAADEPMDLSFAAPSDVVDDPAARARLYVLDSKGGKLSLRDRINANQLHGLTRRYASKP